MMKYIKADKATIDALQKENIDSCDNGYGNSTYWVNRRKTYWDCNKCGWAISYVDDCIISTSHRWWSSNLTHLDKEAGIYHTWCRNLCQICNQETGPNGHPRCNEIIEEKNVEAIVVEADNMMFECLAKGIKK